MDMEFRRFVSMQCHCELRLEAWGLFAPAAAQQPGVEESKVCEFSQAASFRMLAL